MTPQRLKQLNSDMNVGYCLKMAALTDNSLTIESAAARGNPFAAAAACRLKNDAVHAGTISMKLERRRQLDAHMNDGYIHKLSKMSPTRMRAAARGSPFAIFETNDRKSSADSLQGASSNRDDKYAGGAAPTCLRASAAAKGNPFALFGVAPSSNRTSNPVTLGKRMVGMDKSKAAAAAAAGQQRLEASIVFPPNCNRETATTTGLSGSNQPPLRNSLKPKASPKIAKGNAVSVSSAAPPTPAEPVSLQQSNASTAALQVAEHDRIEHHEKSGSLLERRQQDHVAPRVLVPDGEYALSQRIAEEHLAGNRGTVHDGEGEQLSANHHDVLLPRTKQSAGADDDGICSIAKHAASAAPQAASGLSFPARFLDPTETIEDVDRASASMSNCSSVGASTKDNRRAAAETILISMSPRRLVQDQRVRDDDQENIDVASPKTLFPDASHSFFSTTRLPEEQALMRMVQLQLKLPDEVASLVARYMKDTVSENLAASADFPAKFLQMSESSCQSTDSRSFAREALVKAERAVQQQAEKYAREEEERFHKIVAAAQVKKRVAKREK